MRRLIFLLVLFSCALISSGCARQPRVPNTLQLATGTDPSTLDPARSYDTTSINFTRVIYRGLVDYDSGANIVPAVAKEYSVSRDGKTYTFKLRPNARFHFDLKGNSPGRHVVAEDFRYALERVLNPATQSDGFAPFQIIDGAKEFGEARAKRQSTPLHPRGLRVPDESTLIIELTKPDATFLNWLTLPFGAAIGRDWVEKIEAQGQEIAEHPNGCGPFMLKSWTHDKELLLVKNPNYYDQSLPRCERLQLQIGGRDNLLEMRFELGDIDVYSLEETAAPDYLRLTQSAKWEPYIIHAPMMDVRYLSMNNELPPFNDVRVRRAVNYAINKGRIVSTQAGRVQAAKGILPPGMPGYNPQLKGYNYDPNKARALLRAAGYKDNPSKPITLWYADMVWYPIGAQSIQQDLKQIGMTINLKGATYAEVKKASGQRKNIQLSIMGWVQDYPDPSNFLDVMFNSKSITQNASLNRAFYSNPKVDALLNKGATAPAGPQRLALYSKAEQIIVDDAAWVPLVHTERYVAYQPWIEGYKLHPMWSARYEYVKVNK